MVRASHKHILLVFTAAAFVLSGCTSSNIPTGNSFVGNVPDSISMTLSPTSTVDGGSVNAIIVVKDGLGNPVPDGTTEGTRRPDLKENLDLLVQNETSQCRIVQFRYHVIGI